METSLTRRSLEAEQILEALDAVGPAAMTSCPGWSAHHVAAHIAGNYEEVRRHVEAFASGAPLIETRGWETRESPLRELTHAALIGRIEAEERAMRTVVDEVCDRDPEATLRWTGRTVAVAGFPTHMRSEDALHRWDLVGDDDVSRELLAQPELFAHAVHFIGDPLLRRGLDDGAGADRLSARVRAPEQDDLLVEISGGEATLAVVPRAGRAAIDADPAARLLLLWGRKPMPFHRIRAADDERVVGRVQLLFSGY